jgi:hypothetical protein
MKLWERVPKRQNEQVQTYHYSWN